MAQPNACPMAKERDIKFISPDTPSNCTWKLGSDPSTSPHDRKPLLPRKKVFDDVLSVIGNTPLVKLNKIPKAYGIKCDIYAKCEYMNPGGSVKDRIGLRMMEIAEKQGIIKPGATIIEPSSGNTGIALAMCCAIKGYRCIIVMPDKMSDEKSDTLKALGAEIVRTPTVSFTDPEGLIMVCHKLNKQIPNSFVLDQYRHPGNPLAHYDGTAAEIIDAFDGKVDMVVVGSGTGGTLAGVGRKFKELCPTCIVVGADPEGSILAQPAELNKTDITYYEVEGVGYDFIPTVLDRSVVDKWVKTNDKEGLNMSARLISEEGLLCGGSSGGNVAAALKAAKELKAGQKCVVILPDSVRNYMTKFISDSWMVARDLKEAPQRDLWWWNLKVSNLNLKKYKTIPVTTTCEGALKVLEIEGAAELPAVDGQGFLKGMITANHLMKRIRLKMSNFSDNIERSLYMQFRKVQANDSLGKVATILEKEPFVTVVKQESDGETFCGIIRNMDLLSFANGPMEKEFSNKMRI